MHAPRRRCGCCCLHAGTGAVAVCVLSSPPREAELTCGGELTCSLGGWQQGWSPARDGREGCQGEGCCAGYPEVD